MGLFRKLFSKNFRLASDIEKKTNAVANALNNEIREFLMDSVRNVLDKFNADLEIFSKSESKYSPILGGVNDEEDNRKSDL